MDLKSGVSEFLCEVRHGLHPQWPQPIMYVFPLYGVRIGSVNPTRFFCCPQRHQCPLLAPRQLLSHAASALILTAPRRRAAGVALAARATSHQSQRLALRTWVAFVALQAG